MHIIIEVMTKRYHYEINDQTVHAFCQKENYLYTIPFNFSCSTSI